MDDDQLSDSSAGARELPRILHPDEPCGFCKRTRPACERDSRGTHTYRPRTDEQRKIDYDHGLTLVKAALAPTTDTNSGTPTRCDGNG